MKLLAENVRKYRRLNKLSQEALANLSGVEHSTISRIEREMLNTSVSVIFAVSKALNVEPAQLLIKND